MKEVKKKSIFVSIVILTILLGSIIPLMDSCGISASNFPHKKYQNSQTSEYPPFEPPATNASTLDTASVFINGQEIFWRYFLPNTTMMQPKNFRFSFEIWWENPDPDIVIVVDLSENEGESNATSYYGTLLPFEKILETPEGEFIHYAVWMNATYFFMNETWASFGNEFIDEGSLNLTVGIQHVSYYPIFEYTILRDTVGPVLEIIHPNYDESENKLTLDVSNASFEIIITSMSDIKSVTFIVTFLNQTTFEIEDVIIRPMEVTQDPGTGIYYVPSLITEKFASHEGGGGGLMDIDTENPLSSMFVILDTFGYETRKRLDIILDIPNTTPTTTIIDWETMIPIIGSVTIVGATVILLGIRRTRK